MELRPHCHCHTWSSGPWPTAQGLAPPLLSLSLSLSFQIARIGASLMRFFFHSLEVFSSHTLVRHRATVGIPSTTTSPGFSSGAPILLPLQQVVHDRASCVWCAQVGFFFHSGNLVYPVSMAKEMMPFVETADARVALQRLRRRPVVLVLKGCNQTFQK